MFSIHLKDAYFQITVHMESRPYLLFIVNKTYQFKALCFGLSSPPPVFTGVFTLFSKWAHQRGIWLHRYLDSGQLVSNHPFTKTLSSLLVLSRPRDYHQLRGLGILECWWTPSRRLESWKLVDTIVESLYPLNSQITKFWGIATRFMVYLVALVVASWLHGLSGAVYPALEAQYTSTPVAIKGPLIPCWRGSIPVLGDCKNDEWWLWDKVLTAWVPLKQPPPYFLLCTGISQTGWRPQPQELTAAGDWSELEKDELFNTLEMRAVQKALIKFQDRMID